jgi:hypothetical protein
MWDNLVWGNMDFEECFVALRMISVRFPLENCFELHIDDSIYCFNYVIFVRSVCTSESDEDIPTVDTTVAPTATLPHIPQFQGPLTGARACQLNYQVLSFLGTFLNIHENMMLPKSDVFMLLRNDGPSMDERDKHWSLIMHGDDGSNRVRIQDDAASEDFRTLKPP